MEQPDSAAPVHAEPASATDPDGDPPPPFSRIRVRTLVPWAIAAFLVIGIAAAFTASSSRGPGRAFNDWLGMALYAALLAWELVTLRRAGVSVADFARIPSADEWRLAWVGLALAIVSVGTLFLTMLPVSLLAPDAVRRLLRSPSGLPVNGHLSLLTALIAVVIAPPLEELLFRGILFQRWAYKWGVPRAAVLSSVCFGVLHADPIGKFVFGMVMVWLYVRTDSLVVPALAHALHNAVFVLPSLLPAAPVKPADPLQLIRSSWPAALAALALGCLLVAFVMRGSGRLRTWRLPPVQPAIS